MFDRGEIPVFAASFAVVAAFLLMRRFKKNGVKDDGKRYPPSLPVLPFIGAILRGGMTAVPEHFMRSAEKLGPVFTCTVGKRMVVVLNGYDAIVDALMRHSEAFADREALFIEAKLINPQLRGRFLEIEGTNYIHQDLLYILQDICLASTDTMSTMMLWALVELANHPEIQNRFQREIDEMIPGDRLPSLDDKPRLPYTNAVILEIMRRRTVLPFFLTHSTLKDTKVLEYDVPKGCMIIPNAYSAHMDQAYWKDPENFRPERFLDAENKIIDSQRVIAFGLGKRNCIGEILGRQSIFLFLTSLVQRFDIRPPEGQKTINVKEVSAITTTPTHFEVRLIPRVKPTGG